jgi:hypothetical protein
MSAVGTHATTNEGHFRANGNGLLTTLSEGIGEMAKQDLITPEYLRSMLAYDEETGIFTWRSHASRRPQWNGRYGGTRAGWLDPHGYVIITINYENYRAHHLAWLYVFGVWPKEEIDHINMGKGDNWIKNLREATSGENNVNQGLRSDNKSGVKGVFWDRERMKWMAYIALRRRRTYLGRFDSKEEAINAREMAARHLHGEFRRSP